MVLQPLRPVLAVLCCALCLVTAASLTRETDAFCTLGGQRHRMGETWHPVLHPRGEDLCVNCTCYEGGKTQCDKIDCPRPDCDEPKRAEGECCPVCDFGNERTEEEKTENPGCTYDGKHFSDGQTFPSNNTGLRPTRHDQCVTCTCLNEQVFCHLKTCLPTKCTKFKSISYDCCPVCADPKQDNRTDADCSTSMGHHPNGSSWSPEIGTFGIVKCITCTCLNGNVNCTRKKCSPDEDGLPCNGADGSCCKECLPKSPGANGGDLSSSPSAHGRGSNGVIIFPSEGGRKDKKKTGKDKKCRGKKCKGNKKQIGKKRGGKKRGKGPNKPTRPACTDADAKDVHPDRKADVTRVADVIAELCLPRRTDRLVYRSTGDNFELLAFDFLDDESVEMLRWNIVDGKQQAAERQLVEADQFRKEAKCSQIIGATNKRGFKKLLKKVDGKMKKCEDKKRHCTTKSLDKILKRDRRLKPIPTQGFCGV